MVLVLLQLLVTSLKAHHLLQVQYLYSVTVLLQVLYDLSSVTVLGKACLAISRGCRTGGLLARQAAATEGVPNIFGRANPVLKRVSRVIQVLRP